MHARAQDVYQIDSIHLNSQDSLILKYYLEFNLARMNQAKKDQVKIKANVMYFYPQLSEQKKLEFAQAGIPFKQKIVFNRTINWRRTKDGLAWSGDIYTGHELGEGSSKKATLSQLCLVLENGSLKTKMTDKALLDYFQMSARIVTEINKS